MSHIQPQTQSAPARAPSAASQISSHSMSGHESRQSHNGSAPEHGGHPHHQFDQRYQPNRYQAQHQHHPSSSSLGYEYDSHSGMNHQTPQPHPPPQYQPNGHPFPNADPSAYLPSITSSPPPHAPLYVPPPQHAMPPDPIHMQMGGWQGMPPQQHMNGVHPGWRPTNPYLPVSQGYRNGSQGQHPMTTGLDSEHEGHSMAQSQPYPSRGGLGSIPPPPLPHHPAQSLYKSNPMMMPNGSIRSGSSHGEGREKRRDRSSQYRDEDGERDDEVISTIFVVGFPDDMDEREFQNLFTFAPGFEAATLKFPSGSQRREPAAALLAELTQLAAQQQAAAAAALASGEQPDYPLQTPLEEAIAALQLSGSTSSSTTPSAAMSMTPSAPSGPMFGNMLPQLPNRRQTIGFARFKTRQDAITARELLQGRKIDALTGATLKAEMAKKNLHTKKATSGEELVSLLLKSGRLAGYVGNAGATVPSQTGSLGPAMVPIGGIPGVIPPPPTAPSSALDVWDSWSNPQALLSPTASGLGGQTGDRSIGPEQSYPYRSGQYPASTQPTQSVPQQSATQTATSSTSPSASVQSPNARPSDSKALLALAEEADELEGWSVGGSVGISMAMDGFSNSATTNGQLPGSSSNSNVNRSSQTQPGPNSISQPARRERERSSQSNISSNVVTSPILSPNSINQNQQGNNMTMYGRTSDYIGSPNELSGGESGRSLSRVDTTGSGGAGNPADQNPPINTLYVGNLPAISPPTHPPNFLEESLRALFARCPGFKRMSFRQKINGPMCFVEYEDVPFAAQAIKDLYGHNLGGLVKGGIRLSYSKNSLGQRGSMHPPGLNTSMFGGIAHTVALAGMSSPSSTNANSNSYGLQLSHVQGHGGSQITPGLGGQGPHSAPIPMPGDLRRTSDATTLSPNAQPFNASLPVATSPRSRYYGSSPGAVSSNGGAMSATSPSFSFAPGSLGAGGSSGASSSNGSGGSNGTTTQPIPTPGAGHHSGSDQFSPVASPIRTPQSYSWVSSGAGSQGGAVGNGGYGFDPFSPHSSTGLSLNGAASAWSNHGGNSGSTATGAGGHS